MRALEEREEKARVKDEQARALEKRVAERATSLTATERELTRARVQLEAREKVLGKREAEIESESVGTEERLVARARELDERELDLSKKAGDVTARIEQLEQQTASHMAAVQEARAKLEEAQVLGQGSGRTRSEARIRWKPSSRRLRRSSKRARASIAKHEVASLPHGAGWTRSSYGSRTRARRA